MTPARVVVVGDALLDIDVETDVERLVADSAAPVLDERRRVQRPGGAGLAARFAASDSGVEVVLATAVPNDPAGQALRASLDPSVELLNLPCHGATGVKTRLRQGSHVVARLDQGGSGLHVDEVPAAVRDALRSADAVLVSDYGRGVTRAPGLDALLAEVARDRPVLWDPHPRGAPPVPRTQLVTPNAAEAAAACEERQPRSVADACRQARTLVRRWQVGGVAVTLGSRGAVLASSAESAALFPTIQTIAEDPCGAGDRFASRAATALATGARTCDAVAAGVAAATAFLARGGVAGLGNEDPSAPGGLIRDLVLALRARGATIVATGGCFDLLHAGHVAALDAARALGDCLIVCLNSDDSVRRQKGPDRPVQGVSDRRRILESLRSVDAVVVFDEDTPEQVLPAIRPDIWVKGGDYADAALPEAALVRSWGGEVVTVPYVPGLSTTNLLTRVRG